MRGCLPWRAIFDGMTQGDDILQATGPIDEARYSVEKKAAMHAMFETVLDRLDEMQRAPDHWEETCLVHALSFMEAGVYPRARIELDNCIVPAGKRSSWREDQMKRNPRRYTVARLRLRLDGVKADVR
jgi:hypothetical protein